VSNLGGDSKKLSSNGSQLSGAQLAFIQEKKDQNVNFVSRNLFPAVTKYFADTKPPEIASEIRYPWRR